MAHSFDCWSSFILWILAQRCFALNFGPVQLKFWIQARTIQFVQILAGILLSSKQLSIYPWINQPSIQKWKFKSILNNLKPTIKISIYFISQKPKHISMKVTFRQFPKICWTRIWSTKLQSSQIEINSMGCLLSLQYVGCWPSMGFSITMGFI